MEKYVRKCNIYAKLKTKTPIFRTTAGYYKQHVGKAGLKQKLTDYTEQKIALQDDHENGWESWEYDSGMVRSDKNGATFFYTTLTDLIGYIQSRDQSWTRDNAENWLIIITDAHKFDDDPWSRITNFTVF